MHDLGPWHVSPLLHFGHFQWHFHQRDEFFPAGWDEGLVGTFYMTVIFMSRGESHLQGRTAGTARGLGTSVDGLSHCAVTLEGWEKLCFRAAEADPSCDNNPLLFFVWDCEGQCPSAGLCPSLGVTAPFGARFQQQNPCQGQHHSITSFCSTLLPFPRPFPRLTCTWWTWWRLCLDTSCPCKMLSPGAVSLCCCTAWASAEPCSAQGLQ